MDWFLYDKDLRDERFNEMIIFPSRIVQFLKKVIINTLITNILAIFNGKCRVSLDEISASGLQIAKCHSILIF